MVVGITTAAGRWFSSGTPVSSTNKTDITEILLKVVLNTITLTPNQITSTVNLNYHGRKSSNNK
jgi:hypothetical protein